MAALPHCFLRQCWTGLLGRPRRRRREQDPNFWRLQLRAPYSAAASHSQQPLGCVAPRGVGVENVRKELPRRRVRAATAVAPPQLRACPAWFQKPLGALCSRRFPTEAVDTQLDADSDDASTPGLRRSRVQAWMKLHEGLAASVVDSSSLRLEDREEASRVALDAAFTKASLDGENIISSPEELEELLIDVPLFPHFSVEFILKLWGRLVLREGSFGGRQERRQYFRNHILWIYLEKALVMRKTMIALASHVEAMESGFESSSDSMRGVFNTAGACGDDESCAEQEDRLKVSWGLSASFLLDSEEAPYLHLWGVGDYFVVAGRGTSPLRAARDDPCGNLTSAFSTASFLGRATKVVANPGAMAYLLELELHPVGAWRGSGPELEGAEFDLIPAGFIPTVFRRQLGALRRLCVGEEGFTETLRGCVFSWVVGGGRYSDLAAPRFEQWAKLAARDTTMKLRSEQRVLNAEQLAVVAAACQPGPLTFVEGPPGTGKTEVVAAIVEAWLQQDAKEAILVATGTHAARRIIASRLREGGVKLAERRDVVLKKKVAGTLPVFVETVYMAALPQKRHLPRVILDESTQITEVSALVALGQGCKRLVLIGDPKQLGPVSLASDKESQNFSWERSSVYEEMQKRHGASAETVRLSVQYRMEPQLRAYPSARFYGGALADAPHLLSRQLPRGWPGGASSHIVFVDTSALNGREESLVAFRGLRSIENLLEAQVVVNVISGLLSAGEVSPEEVSVLTAYGAQRDRIAASLHGDCAVRTGHRWKQRAAKLMLGVDDPADDEPHPRVHTIDSFQGSENDFIIFSAVRSNSAGSIGFLGDRRRVCVLLTRARRGLLVVGDGSVLERDEEWAAWLLDGCGQRVSASSFVEPLCEVVQPQIVESDVVETAAFATEK